MAFSYWEDQTWLQECDAMVIGGGIVGLSAACRLAELHPDWRIAVIERSAFGDGGTTRNAGFACFGSPAELMEDRNTLGDSAALQLVAQRLQGLHRLRTWLGDSEIGYQACGSHALYPAGDEFMEPLASTAVEDLNQWLSSLTGLEKTFERGNCPNHRGLDRQRIVAADWSPLEGAIHTGRMHRALLNRCSQLRIDVLRGLEVIHLEAGTPVRLKIQRVADEEGEARVLEVARCLLATNAFAKELLPETDARPATNEVIVSAPFLSGTLQGTYHLEAGYVYARHLEGGRVLIGGGRHWGLDREATRERLRALLVEFWPEAATVPLEYQWSGVLGVGAVRSPILQCMGPGIVAAVRLGGMGIAIGAGLGMDAAALLAKSR
jgi:glycine/D-amino acid oxidase-like deaminating enzyme